MQSTEQELPHVFWKKLLEGRYPQWRYLSGPSPRARKKVQYLDELPKIPEAENDEARRKHKKGGNDLIDPISAKTCLEDKRKSTSSDKEAKMADTAKFGCSSSGSSLISPKKAPISCAVMKDSGTGASRIQPDNLRCFPRSLTNNDYNHGSHMSPLTQVISEVPEANMIESKGRGKLRDAQKTLHLLLEPQIAKLCDTLHLPEDVKHMAGKFLEYIMNNHHVNREPVTILQAFQISLCWTAASFLKHKVDHKESFTLAKQHLNFECMEEEAESVYLKLQMLKKRFPFQTAALGNATKSISKVHSSAPRNEDVPQHAKTVEATKSDQQDLEEGEIRESSPSDSLSAKVPVVQEQAPECEEVNTGINWYCDNVNPHHIGAKGSQNPGFLAKCIRYIEKICAQRKNEILLKQQEEIGKFIQFREGEKKKLNEAHRLQSDLIFSTHDDPSVRSDKLKMLDAIFSRKRAEFYRRMMDHQRKLNAMQQAARDKEKQIRASWLEEAKLGQLSKSFSRLPLPNTGSLLESMEVGEQNRVTVEMGEAMLSSGPSLQQKNANSVVMKSAGPTVPSGKSADTSARVLREGMEVMHSKNATLTMQSSNRNVVGSESDGIENTALERDSDANNSGHACSVSSPQQFQIELPSLAQSHTSLGHDNALLSHQVPSADESQPLISAGVGTEDMPSCKGQTSSHQIEVPMLHPDDAVSSQVVGSNDNGSDSQSDVQLQLPPIDVPSFEHNQPVTHVMRSQHEPCSEGCGSHQAEVAMQQPPEALSSQVEQHNCTASQSLSQLPTPVYMDVPLRGMPTADLGSSTGVVQDPSNRPPQSFLNMTARQPQLIHPNPLQNEFRKIHGEEEKAIKMHEDEKIRLKSECDKEIEEVRRKYNGIIHDAEMMFQQRIKAIQMNISKVCQNLLLADAFRLMAADANKPRATALSQGPPSTFSRQSSMQSLPQTGQRPTHALASAQAPGPPTQVVQHPPVLFSGNRAAPHINPIIPPPVNLQVGAELRAPAPHLQPFRPASMSSAYDHLPLIRIPSQQLYLNNSLVTAPPPQLSICPPSLLSATCNGTNLPNCSSALPTFQNPSLSSALELLMDIDNQSGNNLLNLPPLSEPSLTFDSLLPVNLTEGFGRQGAVNSDTTCPTTDIEVVCLSDDD